jgi:shikimate dehydrogenase
VALGVYSAGDIGISGYLANNPLVDRIAGVSSVTIQLGLIGENISRSSAPRLHQYLGHLCGLDVRYTRFDSEGIEGFDPVAVLRDCMDKGFRGLNVTHPFKTIVAAAIPNPRPRTRRVGAVNTVVFVDGLWMGANTDYSGFIRGYRHTFGAMEAGRVLILGAGGVSRAIAFALEELGAIEILIHDLEPQRAAALVAVLDENGFSARVVSGESAATVATEVDGLINATPVGMFKHPGIPLPPDVISTQRWAFDAVYTPLNTQFLQRCRKAGVPVMTGLELFLFQGLDAFRCFTGITVEHDEVRDEVESWMDG